MHSSSLKTAIYALLYYSGVVPLYRWSRRHEVTFVMVHGVMSPEDSDWRPLRWQLDPAMLDKYLARLSRLYEFISASEAVAMMHGEVAFRPNCLVFTIDDGYRNALTRMWPILDKYGIRPLLFVPTKSVVKAEPFWFDQMDYWVQESGATSVDLAGEKIPFDHSTLTTAEQSFRQLMQATRRIWSDDEVRLREVARVIDELKTKCGASKNATLSPAALEWVDVLDLEDIRRCKDLGFEIGSHSESHYRLTHVNAELAQSETQASKRFLEDALGEECQFFGYPEGARSKNVVDAVRAAGYKAAFSSESVGIPEADTEYDIPRVHLPESASDAELVAIVTGFSSKLHQLRNVVRSWTSTSATGSNRPRRQVLRGRSD